MLLVQNEAGFLKGNMIKIILVLLWCVGLSSCAYNEYAGVYKNGLKTGSSITIIQEENYQRLKKSVFGYFESRGYKKIIFSDQKNMFFVFAREGDFELPCQIILKFTQKAGTDKVRIDMVKGSDELVTDSEVFNDIQEIAEQIKKTGTH